MAEFYESKNDVRGKIVIDQIKRYAKRFSEHTGESVSINVEVWCHCDKSGNGKRSISSSIVLYDAGKNRFLQAHPESENLRDLGAMIEKYIVAESKSEQE